MTLVGHRSVSIRQVGRLGNHMIQFLNAQWMASSAPGLVVCGYDMPLWDLSAPCGDAVDRGIQLYGRHVPMRTVASLLRRGRIDSAELVTLVPRLAFLGDVADARRWFTPPTPPEIIELDPDTVVVSVRGEETLGDVHEDYGPLPIAFIEAATAGARSVVFLGQIGGDRYSNLLRQSFPDAQFEESRGPLSDFQTLRNANHIVLALSTFSWVAAWLSEAQAIHVPLTGFYNPRQRPDMDLLPTKDPRYRFYDLGVRRWTGAEADWSALAARDPLRLSTAREVRWLKRIVRRQTVVPEALRVYDALRRSRADRG